MTLTVTHEVLRIALRDPFRIARTDHAEGDGVTTVIVELRDDRVPDVVGVGEGYPDRFYGETPETMAAIWPYLLSFADDFWTDLGDVESARQHLESLAASWEANVRWNGAAKCALDIAFHDFVGQSPRHPRARADRPAARHPTHRLHDRDRRARDRRPARRPCR